MTPALKFAYAMSDHSPAFEPGHGDYRDVFVPVPVAWLDPTLTTLDRNIAMLIHMNWWWTHVNGKSRECIVDVRLMADHLNRSVDTIRKRLKVIERTFRLPYYEGDDIEPPTDSKWLKAPKARALSISPGGRTAASADYVRVWFEKGTALRYQAGANRDWVRMPAYLIADPDLSLSARETCLYFQHFLYRFTGLDRPSFYISQDEFGKAMGLKDRSHAAKRIKEVVDLGFVLDCGRFRQSDAKTYRPVWEWRYMPTYERVPWLDEDPEA